MPGLPLFLAVDTMPAHPITVVLRRLRLSGIQA